MSKFKLFKGTNFSLRSTRVTVTRVLDLDLNLDLNLDMDMNLDLDLDLDQNLDLDVVCSSDC